MKVFFVFCAILATAHAGECGYPRSGKTLNQCAACKALADPETAYSAYKVSTCEVKGNCYGKMFKDGVANGNDDETECKDATSGENEPMKVIGEGVLPVDLAGRAAFITAMCKCQEKTEMGKYMGSTGNYKCYAGCTSVGAVSRGNSGAWFRGGVWSSPGPFAHVCSDQLDTIAVSQSFREAKYTLKSTTFPVADWAQACKDLKCCTDTDLTTLGAAGFSPEELAAKKEAMIAAVLAASASAAVTSGGKTIVAAKEAMTSIDEFCSAAYADESPGPAMMGRMVLAMDPSFKLSGKAVQANDTQFKAALAAAGLCPTAFRFKTAFRHGQKTTKLCKPGDCSSGGVCVPCAKV